MDGEKIALVGAKSVAEDDSLEDMVSEVRWCGRWRGPSATKRANANVLTTVRCLRGHAAFALIVYPLTYVLCWLNI